MVIVTRKYPGPDPDPPKESKPTTMDLNSYQNFPEDDDEHVKIHVPPTSKVTKWSHIEDLDVFFIKLYTYHLKRGYFCILLGGILELVKVLFMLVFLIFLLYFVDYDVLFKNKPPKSAINTTDSSRKLTLGDVVCPFDECFGNISVLTWICISVVLLYWFFRAIKLAFSVYHFWFIKGFFNIALQIPDSELKNITWHEVEKRICEVQVEHKMCIRKNELTELDIYHRILRSKNYLVAMVNKSVLPIHYNLPFVGTVAYLSQGLKYNIELLLFSGTWGFFEDWNLKEDYKKAHKRQELAAKLQRDITWFAIGNLILSPFIFVWQLVYFLFNNAELLKREPSLLALRCWSLYGRLFLRHFNELDHELEDRLKRAYRPAFKYMNTFSSPIMVVISESVIFITGSIVVVLTALSVWDDDVVFVEHVVTIIAVLTVVIAVFRGFIPDENMYWVPETLMIEIVAEVHYLPDTWRGEAHSTFVRDQFAQFFQYKATYLLFELISPFVTPFVFLFKLRPRSLEIIDFYRNFTVNVIGVGDVCSFSLMDMRRHGNPAWQAPGRLKCPENNVQTQAENGKTELSLIHFAKNNPTWHPPEEAEAFINEVQEKKSHQGEQEGENDLHSEALESVSVGLTMASPHGSLNRQSCPNQPRISRLEAPMGTSSYYFNPTFANADSVYHRRMNNDRPVPIMSRSSDIDMSISTLYLHTLHHKKLMSNTEIHGEREAEDEGSINPGSSRLFLNSRPFGQSSDGVSEGTPLLKNVK